MTISDNQRVAPAPAGTLALAGRDPVAAVSADPVSAETRCSCAARHTVHGAALGRQRLEHSGQRPRGSGAWVASRARHPWVKRGSSLRASDSRDPVSALLTSSSSMSSRSHTDCWSMRPRIRSTSPPSRRPGDVPIMSRDTRFWPCRRNQSTKVSGRFTPVMRGGAPTRHAMTVDGAS